MISRIIFGVLALRVSFNAAIFFILGSMLVPIDLTEVFSSDTPST